MASATLTAETAMYTQIDTQWGSTTRIAWPNQKFATTENDKKYLRVDVLWGASFMQTMEPTGRNNTVGVLVLTLFGRKGKGMGELLGLADTARDMVNRVTLTGVDFFASSGPTPQETVDGWMQVQVTTPFQVTETT